MPRGDGTGPMYGSCGQRRGQRDGLHPNTPSQESNIINPNSNGRGGGRGLHAQLRDGSGGCKRVKSNNNK